MKKATTLLLVALLVFAGISSASAETSKGNSGTITPYDFGERS
ncbi:hypothetical protein [Brevibacillus fulvus]|uniref:Uncharacterized protein n=1 Tax=Brevibacillus fulvus TaxID=1125967 RepID=A0A938Y5C4_9BACL|nr:hypothetical protein [Brevibacillus fulvus]MBM7592221.1 hypothetical protein [Brevibacillus fulvus]